MDLPEEVLTEILIRLPVKSLLRLRCVCKGWCDLIKSPSFIRMHLEHPMNNINKYLMLKRHKEEGENQHKISFHSNDSDEDGAKESLSPPLRPPIQFPWFEHHHHHFEYTWLLGPCNGIVCITNLYAKVCLCNPATGEVRKLPSSPFGCPENCSHEVGGEGFGFDPSTNDYKVIRILSWRPQVSTGADPKYLAEVYSLNTNSWRELTDAILPFLCFFNRCTLLFQGRFHWHVWHALALPYEYILSFDMRTEVFDVMQYPSSCVADSGIVEGKDSRLASLDDSLALIFCTQVLDEEEHPTPPLVIDIWVMMEYGVEKSWTKKLSVEPFSVGIHRPICLWKDDKEILLESSSWQLISCALVPDKLDAELKEYDFHGFPNSLQGLIYTESLVSLHPAYMEEAIID